MKKILFIIVTIFMVVSISSCTDKMILDNSKRLRVLYEMGYFNGQKQALQGKYAVSFDGSVYYWSKNLYTFDLTDEELKRYKDFDTTVMYNPNVDEER